MNPNNENTIMQAIMELSGQLKEMKVELTGEMQSIRQDLNRLDKKRKVWMKRLKI